MKRSVVFILMFILTLSPFQSFSAETETLETLKVKAVADSADLLAIDNGIETLRENLTKVLDAREQLRELYDAYKQYQDLYAKGAHRIVIVDVTTLPPETPPEQIQQIMIQNQIAQAYLILQQTFLQLYGITSPSLTSEQIYDNFIFTMDVLPLQLIGQMNNLRIDRQRVEASIKNGVETLWWNLGSLRNQKLLTENYAELVGIQLTAVQNKFNLGQAAEIELSTKKHELDSAKTNDLRLEREVENLEYRLRSLAGLDFSDPFSVSISPGNTITQKMLTFEDYQRLAVRTRVDAIRAQQTLDTIRHEESVMSGYITNENHIRRREIRLKRLETEQALSSLKRDLDAQVFELYHDAMTAKEAYDTASNSLQLAMLERNRYKALFDQGYLSEVDYEGTQMALTQAYIQYESAKYQYAMKLQQLNHAVIYGGSTGGAFQ